jgi:hypothetical protein
MPGVRPFVKGDVERVSDLVWKVLHEKKGSSPASLKTYFDELFLQNPWLDDSIPSYVFEDAQGKIMGFFGVVPRRMSFQGKTIRLAFGSNFVMDPESRASMAAIQLVRAFMKGSQDVSMADSANESSRQLLRSLGFSVVPSYSLQWARPLRPARYVFHAVSRLKKSRLLATIGSVSRPFSAIVDSVVARVPLSPLRQTPPTTFGEELNTDMLLECLTKIPSKHWLLPEYDRDSLGWVLDFLATRRVFGELRKVLIRDKDRKILGWYIYYVAPGAVGEVIQIGAEGYAVSSVLHHLFHDAWKNGLTGLHGRLEPQFMQELTMNSCFFFRNGSWTLVHTSKPELAGLIQSGTAFFSRLDGEWSLRPANES